MGKNGISPGQIPHLVRLTADLFREMREGTKSPNNNPINKLEERNQMHFVVDLLKDLVDIGYPIKKGNIENTEIDVNNLIKVAEFQSFDEMMEAIEEIVKGTKLSRKDGF